MEIGALSYVDFTAIVIGCLAIEAIALLLLWQFRRKGLKPTQTFAFLGAGASFTAALLVVAADAPLSWFAISLACAFVFHVWDMVQRWRS
ncbi:MAG: hypothetical protein AAF562_06805 [Pseudomonadota bacterium]